MDGGEERREVSREIIHGRAQLTTSLMIEVEDRGRDEITEINKQGEISCADLEADSEV